MANKAEKQKEKENNIAYIISFVIIFIGLFISIIVGGYVWRGSITWKIIALVFSFVCISGYIIWRGFFKRALLINTGIEVAVGFFFLGIMGSWILSPDPRQGLERTALLIGYIVLFYVLVDCFDAGFDRSAALNSLLLISGGILFITVLETYTRYTYWWDSVGDWRIMPPFPYRFTSIIGHSNALMGLANLCAPIVFIYFFKNIGLFKKILLAFWIILYIAVIPFSSSRGGWIGIIAWVGIMIFMFLWENINIKKELALIREKIIWFIPLAIFFLGLAAYLGFRFINIFSLHPSHGSNPFSGRLGIWSAAIEIWRRYPIFGAGPGRFGYEYLNTNQSIPPNFWAAHAHSLPMQILAEFGLFGLVCFTVLLVSIIVWAWRQYGVKKGIERKISLGIIAGLGGWLAQMMVDEQTRVLPVMVTLIILVAYLVTNDKNPIPRWSQIRMNIISLPLILLLVFSTWNIWNYSSTVKGLDAYKEGNRLYGAILIERSITNDQNYPYYNVMGAYAWAENLKDDDISDYSVEKARLYLRNVLEKEKNVSLLWANLSVLDWNAGDKVTCVRDLENAIALSPKEPSYYLNLGNFMEKMSKLGDAKDRYKKALKLKPDWSAHPFWSTSEVRQRALEEWKLEATSHSSENDKYWQQAFNKVLEGDFMEAEKLLAYSEWVGEPSLAIQVVKAELAKQKSGMEYAIDEYENIVDNVSSRKLHNSHSFALTFSQWLYSREGFSHDYVPGYLQLDSNYGQFRMLEELYGYYEANGFDDDAERVWLVMQREVQGGILDVIPYN